MDCYGMDIWVVYVVCGYVEMIIGYWNDLVMERV